MAISHSGFVGDEASNDSCVIENVHFRACYIFVTLGNKVNIVI